jgi:hypothetical protein
MLISRLKAGPKIGHSVFCEIYKQFSCHLSDVSVLLFFIEVFNNNLL